MNVEINEMQQHEDSMEKSKHIKFTSDLIDNKIKSLPVNILINRAVKMIEEMKVK